MRCITSSMSNGSFGPFAIGVFTTRLVVVFRVAFSSPRARRVAILARGGKNDAREDVIRASDCASDALTRRHAAWPTRVRRFGSGCT
jgi:hypothetical protein